MGNISKEGDAAGVPTPNERYQYDPLYRLKEVDAATGALWQMYSYSKTGDRLSKNTAGITPVDVYHYATGTHHLNSITGADASARSFDANGNTTALQANGWTYGLGYNNTNRLSLIQQNGSTIMQYKLDGKGERVRKVPSSGSATEYVYDETGKLLYEYVGLTNNRSYIWADDTLIATVEADSSIHYIYTDHLGTPRAATTTTSSTPIWTWPWTQNPFGEKPASGSGYALNVRYPGQYFDQETGLNYNYFRDYEPATGRYPQSDPLGLWAGVSTYAYVKSAPLVGIDALGLADVLVWPAYDGWGHAALRLDDGTYISYWPQPANHEYPLGDWLQDFFTADPIVNDTYDHDSYAEGRFPTITHLDNLDEAAIKKWWDQLRRENRKWNSAFQNCSTTVADALSAGGADKHLPDYPKPLIWRPEDIQVYAEYLRMAGSGSIHLKPMSH